MTQFLIQSKGQNCLWSWRHGHITYLGLYRRLDIRHQSNRVVIHFAKNDRNDVWPATVQIGNMVF